MSYRTKKQKIQASKKMEIKLEAEHASISNFSGPKIVLPAERKAPAPSNKQHNTQVHELFGYDVRLIYRDLFKTFVITLIIIGILLVIVQRT